MRRSMYSNTNVASDAMRRMWIVVGDPTSSGGRVITGSRETDIDGVPVARVGDRASCPRHGGVFAIVDGDASILIDGQPVALDGAHLACGCTVTTQRQTRAYVEVGDGSAGLAMSAVAGAERVPSLLAKPPVCLECLLSGAAAGAPLLLRA
ncbi:PAAR domain-containing protein [Xanthomonas maliensis]|uniref:PAAR domain-containing protein n=1 Tax=Xanthomonas maliensis TaxID=1321368 RepID=UPI001FD5D988|nr:PAAR domain-containing protein [Xanthomonas maliensis]